MPAIYGAVMGEIEQTHSLSGSQFNGHDRRRHFMLIRSFQSTVSRASSSPRVRRRHWAQTYSLDKLLHSRCLCNALGARVTGRTRITSKRRIFLYPSHTAVSSWRCLKAHCLEIFLLRARFLLQNKLSPIVLKEASSSTVFSLFFGVVWCSHRQTSK